MSDDSSSQSSSTVAAMVNGRPITLSEIEAVPEVQGARSKVLQAQGEYFMAQHQAVEKVIDDRVLAAEAARQHITVDELLKRNVKDKVKDPNEEMIHIYYLALSPQKSLDELKPKIIYTIRKLQEDQIEQDYVEKLRARNDVLVMLQPPQEKVTVGQAPTFGSDSAPVTVIEFADYQCPYCRQFESGFDRVRSEFKGNVRYSFRDFPLPMHPLAEKAAEAARCAGEQGKFWPYHDRLFSGDASDLAVPSLKAIARQMNLDGSKFDQCLDSGRTAGAIAQDMDAGKRLGITGTPTLFINGHVVSGALRYELLHELVQQQIVLASEKNKAAAKSSSSDNNTSSRTEPLSFHQQTSAVAAMAGNKAVANGAQVN